MVQWLLDKISNDLLGEVKVVEMEYRMLGFEKKDAVRLYYYKYPNIGDILNEYLVEQIFHVKAIEEPHITAEMIAIGSVLDRLLKEGRISKKLLAMQKDADKENPIHVWGTGLMYDYDTKQEFIRPLKVHAVRGELTRKKVSEFLGKECKCVLADPGLLASLLVPKNIEKKFDVGIIPHYVDADEPVMKEMKQCYENSVIINVKAEPMKVLKKIARCRTIVSTSLHGLIIADSFHIPNQWCVCSDRILGDGFKFRDYYSAFGLEAKPVDLRKDKLPDIVKIREEYAVTEAMVKQKQKELIRCFPYKTLRTYLKSYKI